MCFKFHFCFPIKGNIRIFSQYIFQYEIYLNSFDSPLFLHRARIALSRHFTSVIMKHSCTKTPTRKRGEVLFMHLAMVGVEHCFNGIIERLRLHNGNIETITSVGRRNSNHKVSPEFAKVTQIRKGVGMLRSFTQAIERLKPKKGCRTTRGHVASL